MKQFLRSIFERIGLAEAPLPPPSAADVALGEPPQMQAICSRLAAWGVKQIRFVANDSPNAEELFQAVRQAKRAGIKVDVRGRASDLPAGNLLTDLAAAGACEVELPILSAVAEVHDALAGLGDARRMTKALDALASSHVSTAAQLVLTPSTTKMIERTLEMLNERHVPTVRVWAIVCRDDEPASWALSADELVKAAARIEAAAPAKMKIAWYPPLRFDPARTLAQQVRRGPRAARDAVRVEADGQILPPLGPAIAGGNVLQSDWKPIARSEVFRAWKWRSSPARCETCPKLAACTGGCLRDEGYWADDRGS